MSGGDAHLQDLGRRFLGSLDQTHVNAAASKLFAASLGEAVMLLSRSPTHKHCSLADIEWLVLPAITSNQFYLVEAAHKERGFRVPIAYLSWAFVSDEVDRRLAAPGAGPRTRLRPDEWNSGEIAWLIDAVGSAEGVKAGLGWLKEAPFKERRIKLIANVGNGGPKVQTLDEIMTAAKGHAE
jgi:hemolysin-activating ACP:hemolysin acyltransferase